MTEDEKAIVREAIDLLENATSNSLDPAPRINWKVRQRRITQFLREMIR